MGRLQSAAVKFVSFLPIASYPLQRDFRRRKTVISLCALAFVLYVGLTFWNVETQGQDQIFTSVLLNNFVMNKTTQCTARTMDVGDSFFTRPSGILEWSITGVDMVGGDGTGFAYNGVLLGANVTFVSLIYQFAGQTYSYEVCANTSVPFLRAINGTHGATTSNPIIVSMCANFDITKNSQPSWVSKDQSLIQNRVYGIGGQFFQELNFPNGSFPQVLFPPYGQPGGPAPSDTSISPNRLFSLSTWLDGFTYLPNDLPSTGTENDGAGATHQMVILNGSQETTSIASVLENTIKTVSGFQLNMNGVGGLRLQTELSNSDIGFDEPPTISNMRNYSLGTLNLILDMASNDLQNRTIQSSYLCTITTVQWKKPLSMIAMILGNNSALFGFALGLLIQFAAWREERNYKEAETNIGVPIAHPQSWKSEYDTVSTGDEFEIPELRRDAPPRIPSK